MKVYEELKKDLGAQLKSLFRKRELKVLLDNMQILFVRTSLQDSDPSHEKYSQQY